MSGHAIRVENVSKRFGETTAVDDIDLAIGEGEFFSLLGPSGCGKTTTLRMIAGFETPTDGRIVLRGQDVTAIGPARRNLNMVFQEYGLFPHMTVADNVGFGLKVKGVRAGERTERVREAIAAMQLSGLERRRPAQLSGGQRQRVALARALVNRPAALLLDEPLGALDFKLRKEMQLELKRIQQRTGTTFVYVTHDQEEALTMSDRIAVMSDGRVEQLADPRTLYERPATVFVAEFIGVSNLLELHASRRAGGIVAMERGGGHRLLAPDPGGGAARIQVTIRPERIKLDPPDLEGWSRVAGAVAEVVYLGSMTQLIIDLEPGEQLVVHLLNDDEAGRRARAGDAIVLGWPAEASYVLGSDQEAQMRQQLHRPRPSPEAPPEDSSPPERREEGPQRDAPPPIARGVV
jgi:spermidine/putrescine transport system ATP-binding protein